MRMYAINDNGGKRSHMPSVNKQQHIFAWLFNVLFNLLKIGLLQLVFVIVLL